MLILTLEDLTVLVEKLKRVKELTVDTETEPDELAQMTETKKDALILDRARLAMVQFCWGLKYEKLDGKIVYQNVAVIPVGSQVTKNKNTRYLSAGTVIGKIRCLLEDKRIVKIFHNANYDVNVFINYGVNTRNDD